MKPGMSCEVSGVKRDDEDSSCVRVSVTVPFLQTELSILVDAADAKKFGFGKECFLELRPKRAGDDDGL